MSVAEWTQKKDGEDDKSQGHDQMPPRPIGDLLEMLPPDHDLPVQSDNHVAMLLLDDPELDVPTHLPEGPTDSNPLQLTTWTVVESYDEPKTVELLTEKPKKLKESRSCGFGWIVDALLSPFRPARVPNVAVSRSNEKPIANEEEITNPTGKLRKLLITSICTCLFHSAFPLANPEVISPDGSLHTIGFSTATQQLLASLAQEDAEYIYLATSLPNASGQLRVKLGRASGRLEPGKDNQACELASIWQLPVANASRVEKLALVAVKSEFDSGQSKIPFILAIEGYGSNVQCPCSKTHQDIFLIKNVECDWLKNLVIGLDKVDKAERQRDLSAHELGVSLNLKSQPVVRDRVLPESATEMREDGAIAA